MASSSSVLCEDQLQCSICLDVFTDPVSTPCGHNFCMICLKEFWDSSSHCQCPECKTHFPKRPELCVNTFISGLAARVKKSDREKSCSAADQLPFRTEKSQHSEIPRNVQQKIQERMKKIEEIKRSLKLNKKNTEKEKADVVEIFSVLMRCIERSQAELLKVMEEKQEAAERQAEEFIKELEQEITELKRRNTELEQLSHAEDHLLQIDVKMISHLSVLTLRRNLSQLQETLNEKMKKLPEIILKRMKKYAVDVALDPDTAHPELILSDDGKQVRHQGTRQNLPDNPERFNSCPSVLGKEGFSSGRFYYEVQVRGNTEWDLGVATESVNRKGRIIASPKNGYWSIWLRNKTEYKACDSQRIPLSLKQAPQKVGVFVDYEEGLISFYDVEAKSHIYTFTGQAFSEKLYPYFCPSLNYEGKISKLLIITPVQQSKYDYFTSEISFTMCT